MADNAVTLDLGAWHGDRTIQLVLPRAWRFQVMGPNDAPELADAGIEAAFDNPIGTPRLAELARGKKSAAIVVDDLARPTPAARVIPHILRELAEAGIPPNATRFVVGVGTHRPMTPDEMALKLGREIVAEFPVANHDFMGGDLCGLGQTADGLPIYINRIVAEAEFKLCVGGIYPHGGAGFGGGSKLVLPGVSGFTTISCFHRHYGARGHAVIERQGETPDLRDVSEEVARILGLDAVVNMVINSRREIAGVFVGDVVAAHRAGARVARRVYATHIPESIRQGVDLMLVNCYPFDADAAQLDKALWPAPYVKRTATVVVNAACDGTCYHGFRVAMSYDRFCRLKASHAPMNLPNPKMGLPSQMFVWSENAPVDEFRDMWPTAMLYREWSELLQTLTETLPDNAQVAVFPCSALQFFDDGSRDV